MIEIPRLRATTYIREMAGGRTIPGLFACPTAEGEREIYVVKSFKELGRRTICEYIAAVLGRWLGLPVPPVAVIDVDQRLAASIPDIRVRDKFTGTEGPHFGSLYMHGGYFEPPKELPISKTAMTKAVDVFAWDMLIQNPDRSYGRQGAKPNFAIRGPDLSIDEFIIFDHELAFSFLDLLGPQPDPWDIRSLRMADSHVFYNAIRRYSRRSTITFAPFVGRFAAVPEPFKSEMVGSMPQEWHDSRMMERIVLHLTSMQANSELFTHGLLEVFA